MPQIEEDEFKCLNLNITCPPRNTYDQLLPVIVWIHGMSRYILAVGNALTVEKADHKSSPLPQRHTQFVVSLDIQNR